MTERTLDELMDLDPLQMSDRDIDEIIAYQRQHRARVEGGSRAKKEKGPGLKIDLSSLGLAPKAAPTSGIKRRV